MIRRHPTPAGSFEREDGSFTFPQRRACDYITQNTYLGSARHRVLIRSKRNAETAKGDAHCGGLRAFIFVAALPAGRPLFELLEDIDRRLALL